MASKRGKKTTKASGTPPAKKKAGSNAEPGEAPKGSRPIVLAARLTIQDIGVLKARLVEHCQLDEPAVVDASAVETVDTAALQLLVAFANSMYSRSQTIEWREPSAVFTEMAMLADLSKPLDLHMDAGKKENGNIPQH